MPSSRRSAGSSFANGRSAAAVAPVSALELVRVGTKRRRTTNDGNNDPMPSSSSPSSLSFCAPPQLCLLQNPYLSLPIGLSELAGPAGAGKTQIALGLCADCVLYHGDGDDSHTTTATATATNGENEHTHTNEQETKQKAVYVHLGGSSRFLQTASRRLEGMLDSRIRMAASKRGTRTSTSTRTRSRSHSHSATSSTGTDHPAAESHRAQQRQHTDTNNESNDNSDESNHTAERVHDCLTRILVHWVSNSEDLMDLLRTKLPRLLRTTQTQSQSQPQTHHATVSLVVLDGIANLFRLLPDGQPPRWHRDRFGGNTGGNPWHHRAATFFQISGLCKELSSRFRVPFVVLNECTTRIPNSNNNTINSNTINSNHKAVLQPALGLAWSQCVNCSFFVRRESGSRRVLQCLKAPHISSEHSRAEFWIDRSGVVPIRYNESTVPVPVRLDEGTDGTNQ